MLRILFYLQFLGNYDVPDTLPYQIDLRFHISDVVNRKRLFAATSKVSAVVRVPAALAEKRGLRCVSSCIKGLQVAVRLRCDAACYLLCESRQWGVKRH